LEKKTRIVVTRSSIKRIHIFPPESKVHKVFKSKFTDISRKEWDTLYIRAIVLDKGGVLLASRDFNVYEDKLVFSNAYVFVDNR